MVIAIIGILASFAMPAIQKARTQAEITRVKADLAAIRNAIEAYFVEYDTYPPMGGDKVGGFYNPTEDLGKDGLGPYNPDGTPNNSYVPDEGDFNYRLDEWSLSLTEDRGLDFDGDGNIDCCKDNKRLDGTYADRMGTFFKQPIGDLTDLFSTGSKRSLYKYYAAYSPEGDNTSNEFKVNTLLGRDVPYYDRWVLFSVGPDGHDNFIKSYWLATQDGEDLGTDGFATDPRDVDSDGIKNEFTTGERNGELDSGEDKNNNTYLDMTDGHMDFDFDFRTKQRDIAKNYPLPDYDLFPDKWDGIIMIYGP